MEMSDGAPSRRALPRRAVFLDRDGTINVEKNYLYRISDWEWIQGATAAIRRINQMGWLVIVVTNQAGVARGLYDYSEVARLHQHVDALLEQAGARIDGYYLCPHHPDFGDARDCDCRKPRPGLLLRAARDFGIELRCSFLIGDKISDVQAGRAANVTPILVATGHGAAARATAPAGTICVADLTAAMNWIEGTSL
jgi:D-glycero-D-manno-heptose 1,7-bisphosphate phosphatase